VIQEFAHVHGRRRPRAVAARLARRYAEGLTPLLVVDRGILEAGLDLYERHEELGAFDAVLAAVAIAHDASALVSADADFSVVSGLRVMAPGSNAFDELLS
jgi:predicted nucleic acid-binding protein